MIFLGIHNASQRQLRYIREQVRIDASHVELERLPHPKYSGGTYLDFRWRWEWYTRYYGLPGDLALTYKTGE